MTTVYSADVLLGGVEYRPNAFMQEDSGWAGDIVYSSSIPQGVLSIAAVEASDVAAITAHSAQSGRTVSAALAEAGDATSFFIDTSSDRNLVFPLVESGDQMALVMSTGEVTIIARHRLRGSVIESTLVGADQE